MHRWPALRNRRGFIAAFTDLRLSMIRATCSRQHVSLAIMPRRKYGHDGASLTLTVSASANCQLLLLHLRPSNAPSRFPGPRDGQDRWVGGAEGAVDRAASGEAHRPHHPRRHPGPRPNVPMKDSGVEWLGEIPAHWEVKRLKFLLQEPLQYGANEPGRTDGPDYPSLPRRRMDNRRQSRNGCLHRRDVQIHSRGSVARPYFSKGQTYCRQRSGRLSGKFRFEQVGAGRHMRAI